MVTVLVVDDDSLALRCTCQIARAYPDEALDVAGASSGTEAVALSARSKPDVVLMDIEMPEMNGFSVIQAVKKQINPDVRVILVSGHDRFEYCKQAIDIQAVDYVLKPIRAHELHAAIRKAIDELREQEKTSEICDAYALQCDQNLLLEMQRFQGEPSGDLCLKLTERLNSERFGLIVIRDLQPAWQRDANILRRLSLEAHHAKRSCREAQVLCARLREIEYVLIYAEDGQSPSFKEGLLSAAARSFGVYSAACLGGSTARTLIGDLARTTEAARSHLTDPSGGLSQQRAYPVRDIGPPTLSAAFSCDILALESAVVNGDYRHGERFLRVFAPARFNSYPVLKTAVLWYCERLAQGGCFLGEPDIGQQALACLGDARVVGDVFAWLYEKTQHAAEWHRAHYAQNTQQRVLKVAGYIKTNYAKTLTLNTLSEMACVTPPHFCHVFKRVTGKSYLQYQTEFRMQKAFALLTKSSLMVEQIAQQVGYENVGYFRRVFKRLAGMSPNEFRGMFAERVPREEHSSAAGMARRSVKGEASYP